MPLPGPSPQRALPETYCNISIENNNTVFHFFQFRSENFRFLLGNNYFSCTMSTAGIDCIEIIREVSLLNRSNIC
jgi:hypothetical protein